MPMLVVVGAFVGVVAVCVGTLWLRARKWNDLGYVEVPLHSLNDDDGFLELLDLLPPGMIPNATSSAGQGKESVVENISSIDTNNTPQDQGGQTVLVLFDGDCVLCNASAQFIHQHNQGGAPVAERERGGASSSTKQRRRDSTSGTPESDGKSNTVPTSTVSSPNKKKKPLWHFRLSSLQSLTGRGLVEKFEHLKGVDSSIVLWYKESTCSSTDTPRSPTSSCGTGSLVIEFKSRAALRVLMNCDEWYYRWAGHLGYRLLPVLLRDEIYDWVARHRYQWFGKKADICRRPAATFRSRMWDAEAAQQKRRQQPS